jgi:hypothetical protein
MATLTEAAFFSRRAIRYGAIAIVAYIILRIVFAVLSSWWRAAHPPPPPPATVAFGNLPPLVFPQQEKPEFTFSLETVDGTTGNFGPTANVYVVPEERGSLLALERTSELARRLDFTSEPERVSDTVYRWSITQPLPASLVVDLLTEHLTYDVNWRVQPQLTSDTQALAETDAIAEARNWLAHLQLLTEDLGVGEAKLTYLKVSGTEIVPALSQSEAQFVQVDLFRSNVVVGGEEEEGREEFSVMPLNPDQGLASVILLKPSRTRTIIVHGVYRYIPIAYDQSATYPLISSQDAWERLQSGAAYYASVPQGLKSIAIRRISLAYLDPIEAGNYLQPIFVFEGDQGFRAYLPAVADKALLGAK